MAESTIRTITSNDASHEPKEVITNDIGEMLEALIWQSIEYVGIPVAHMSREDKIKGLAFLEEKGAFLSKIR
jgi:hypothetical protein